MDNNNTLVHLENNKKGLFHLSSIIQYFLDVMHIMSLYATSIINNCIMI